MKDFKISEAFIFVLKYFIPLSLILALFGGCYWELYVKPKVDDKIRPLIVGIFEIQVTLNKVVSEKTRRKVRKEVEDFEKLLQNQN